MRFFFPAVFPIGLSSDHPITIQLSSYHPISSQLSVKLDDNLMITGWYQFSVIIQLSSICLFRFQVLVLLFSLLALWSCVSGKSATARAASVAWWCGDDVGSRQATGQKLRRSGSQWRTGESLENNSTIWGYQLNSIDIYIYTWKAIIPFFLGQTALTIFFGHYGFDRLEPLVWELLRPFFNKMSKKYGFATGRLAWELLRFFTFFFQQNVEKIRFCYG